MKKCLFSLLAVATVFQAAFAEQLSVSRTAPADGATNVAINAQITIVFKEAIALGSGQCTINGNPVSATVTSTIAKLVPPCLEYGTVYKFHAPEGAFTSKSDASKLSPEINVTFTTKERPRPAARVFDAVVAPDGSGDYKTIREAIAATPEKCSKPWLIFVTKGRYNELVRIPETKPFIHLIGEDRDSTIIEYKINCGWSEGGWHGTDPTFPAYADKFSYSYQKGSEGENPVFFVNSSDFYAENISFVNLWGKEDRDFPQALTVKFEKDRVAMYNCSTVSYQDTWFTGGNGSYRQYVKDCFIEGNVDFIYGSGDVLFDSCHINIIKNRKWHEEKGWIVAPNGSATDKWGYVFTDCYLSGESKGDSIFLGRPWHGNPKSIFIRLRTDENIVLRQEGWDTWNTYPSLFADWGTVDAKGNPVDLSKRRSKYWTLSDKDTIWQDVKCRLTDEEAAQYTFMNIIPGTDGWRPDLMMERLPAPTVSANGQQLSWNAVDYAICYEVLYKGAYKAFTKETTFMAEGAAGDYQVRAINEAGGLGLLSSAPTGLEEVMAEDASIVAVEYYNLLGYRLDCPKTADRQIVLCKTIYSNGRTAVKKVCR